MASKLTTWVLTREAADAAADAEALARAGVKTALVPCIECVPLPWPRWPAHPGVPVVVLTSRRAAQGLPRGENVRVAAVAPTTAAALRAEGVKVDIEATGGAAALGRAVFEAWESAGKPAWNIRYPTSDAGLESEEQQAAVNWLARVGPVERRVVYETRRPEGLAQSFARVVGGPWSVVFASPSAVEAFSGAREAEWPAPERVVCWGASTARAWERSKPAGWSDAVQAKNSAVETILSIKEQTP